jgi:hypothetical protein
LRSDDDQVNAKFIGGNQQTMYRTLNSDNRLHGIPERRGKLVARLLKDALGKNVSKVLDGRRIRPLAFRSRKVLRREVKRDVVLPFREQSPTEANRRRSVG